jgi:hypothetical protein
MMVIDGKAMTKVMTIIKARMVTEAGNLSKIG